MNRSQSSRPDTHPKRATHVQDANQDSIISRVLPAFLENARIADSQGQQAECAVWLHAAALLEPARVETVLERIDSLLKQHRVAEAVKLGAQLVDTHPQHALALWYLGYVLQCAGRHADAIPFYERAHRINAAVPSLRNNLAVAYELTGRATDALKLLEEAVAANSADIEAWTNLARMYPRRWELEHALAAGKRAVQIDSSNALALSNYSLALKEAQRWEESTAVAESAVNVAPHMARLPFNLSILDLLQGNYARGWANFESRWDGSGELVNSHPKFNVPRWNGESLKGKTLLLWGEQGFGDALQFSRFVPMLAKKVSAQGGKLVWAAFKAVYPLMARMAPKSVECIPHDGPLPEFDFHFPMLSLPLHFGIEEDTIPSKRAYLSTDTDLAAEWRTEFASDKRLRVGLVWSGSESHQRNMFRSVGIERYAQAFKGIENVAFFSLQKEASGAVSTARDGGFEIADRTGKFETFDDTAAFIDSLDLVITVCTSVAHLAAALGKPTWILLDVNPHWVWQLERTDSPWYPTARLYRQKNFGQWEPVMTDVARDLAMLAATHTGAAPRKRAAAKKTAV
ncbi:TPR repeat-containing protein [Caballeronia sordidicola]|uniref:TPR repeat-containing protein n=1 Tax=Caballeronia sordidicola TaxID=196367 RepID=A0A158FA59_CABSO|nr:tetratricopeptide repeat protein [Caballeronia sordidicola]SAL16792.1 TPR repeat-containing protein [Caballeronia sordidicola]